MPQHDSFESHSFAVHRIRTGTSTGISCQAFGGRVEPVAMGNDNPPHNLRHEVRHITCGGSRLDWQTVSVR